MVEKTFESNLSNKSPLFKSIFAGSVAGGVGYLGTVPLDFLKQQMQTKSTSLSTTKQLIRASSVKTLFAGSGVGCAAILPQMTIKFATNDFLKRNTQNNAFVNGFIAGYADGTFLGPVLTLQSLKQMNTNMSYNEALQTLKMNSFYSLSFPMAMRNASYTATMFSAHSAFQPKQREKQTFLNTVGICSVFNIPATVICSPFDVVRARQVQKMLLGEETNPFSLAKQIYTSKGIKGFYQGYSSLFINFALRFPLTFALYETVSRIIE